MLGLDVKRTDRALVFFEKQDNLAKLWDILSVYAWIDGDVGYCQGQLSSEPLLSRSVTRLSFCQRCVCKTSFM